MSDQPLDSNFDYQMVHDRLATVTCLDPLTVKTQDGVLHRVNVMPTHVRLRIGMVVYATTGRSQTTPDGLFCEIDVGD